MIVAPTYLAPEVVGEDGFYGFAVDAYSIGVVLYSCLANATPFNEDSKVPLAERMKARVVDSGELRDLKISENG